MSRHRDVRNLNINAELDDDALSDGGEEEIDPQYQGQLEDSFEQVRVAVSDQVIAELTEKAIKRVLWDSYFDVESTIQWCLEDYERKRFAKERKDGESGEVDADVWSRVPKIMQAQPEGGYLTAEEYSPRQVYRLSTITEKTEKTETRQSLVSATTSYGVYNERNRSIDPNSIPPSPPASAIHRLSSYDGPPSNPRSESAGSRSESGPTPQQSMESVPAIHVAPGSPSSVSSKSLPPKPASKLSLLASSRTSAVSSRTQSSRSSGTSVTGSIKTFPALRPSPESELAPSTPGSSAVSKSLPPTPPNRTSTVSTVDSKASSLVRKAIQNALHLESMDKIATLNLDETIQPESQSPRSPSPTKSQATDSSKASTVKPMSKLAMLAQQRIDSRGPKLPPTTTEYLTPIANGPSVTTAITTSYQSLYSLVDPKKSSIIPKLDVVPLQSLSSPSASSPPSTAKVSKLAMKSKQGQKRTKQPQEIFEEEYTLTTPPIFQTSLPHYRASPSAFGSLLVDNIHTADSQKRTPTSPSTTKSSDKHRSRKAKPPPPSTNRPGTSSFAFDSPSPDDIVLKARKGTNLVKRGTASVTSGGTGK
ncbi:hypothetical protein FA15DRAFT_700173 [Coprinopsis marcescibilis]|uniref:HBS1-like protein N-terminal domain-containing protein n=1 Tax=Coprinopsis marcescibilis TaxID=230819 RepID=A0A5C3LB26_COPMA|nr:hypothetical protein FA15DRAFT_700173 [Coprinopsis marcescibilis]